VIVHARSAEMLGACLVGEWLSLVEHLVRDQVVGGSKPLSPTNLSLNIPSELEPLHFHCLMPIAGKAGFRAVRLPKSPSLAGRGNWLPSNS
jgi:hypothetical protein